MPLLPQHTASKREQRDTEIVFCVTAGISVAFAFYGLITGHDSAWVAAIIFAAFTLWFVLAHLFGPKE